ncbi:putative DNA helicase ino80 [Vigna radiata var. radiata]|uniref:DNA helicase ino80 n=1 Tax=Vigna radiata var. radiata TaxID=3916 RepID=A0A3Q0EQ37_VIGRR|nr:putative DNA helicase ino80 [Vigna radiata var. radiata]
MKKKASARAASSGPSQDVPPPMKPPPARVTVAVRGPTIGVSGSTNVAVQQGEGTSVPPPSHNTPLVNLTGSATAAPVVEIPSESAPVTTSGHRKRKSRKGGKSSSKRHRREGKEPVTPLSGGVFSPDYNVSHFIEFNRGPTYVALLESLPGRVMLDSVSEMANRTAAMIDYIREHGDVRGSGEVKELLNEEEKKAKALEEELAGARKALEDEKKRSAEKLQETTQLLEEEQKAKAVAEENQRQLEEDVARLKEVEEKLQGQTVELHTELKKPCADLKTAEDKIISLNDSLVAEHEDGFYKAIRQVEVLMKVEKPLSLGFDIYKDVYHGVLMDIKDPEVAEAGEETAEGDGEQVEVVGSAVDPHEV